MFIALTGTPGTGKTTLTPFLKEKGYTVIDLNAIAQQEEYILGIDEKRKSNIIDLEKIDKDLQQYNSKSEPILIESHLAHLLPHIQKIIVLRCHPAELKKRLKKGQWNDEKIKENLEAEILDIILCESIDKQKKSNVFEIDTSQSSPRETAHSVIEIIENKSEVIQRYKIGNIDWSEEILRDF